LFGKHIYISNGAHLDNVDHVQISLSQTRLIMKLSISVASLLLGALGAARSIDIESILANAVSDPSLPMPPGPYQVGTAHTQLVDHSRQDPWAPKPEHRKLVLQIWYPIANGSSKIPASYMQANAMKDVDEKLHQKPGSTAQLRTNTFTGGSPVHPLVSKDGELPVIVFSPGAGVASSEYTTFHAPLASYGYIVIGMDHLYDSSPVELADGTIIDGNLGDKNHTKNAIAAGYRRDDAMFLAKQTTTENLLKWISGSDAPSAASVKKLRLGIYGQSLGGSTAALAVAEKDSPYRAAMSFDGPFYGSIAQTGFYGPFLFFAAEDSLTHDTLKGEWPKIKGWKRSITLKGTTHYDYSDLNVLVPQAKGTLLEMSYGPKMGKLGPTRRTIVIAEYLQAFFDYSLRDMPVADFLDKESPKYPEIQFDSA
jgi:dienelactone hydrolase